MTAARRFLKKALVFMIPLLVYAGFIGLIDPFNYFGADSPIPYGTKHKISFPINYAMWKIIDFRRHPEPNILLGDSRMMSLDPAEIEAVSGRRYYNLAYGGGSLREAIDTFWIAAQTTDLKDVVVGVNLNNFNDNDRKDRVAEVRAVLANPFIYLVNRNVLNATTKIVKQVLTGAEPALGVPDMDREEFWERQLNVTTRGYYSNYAYPTGYLAELAKVHTYCSEHAINLSFIIFPSHHDLQSLATQYNLGEAARKMPEALAALGPVYDFCLDNELTRGSDHYKDPYHLKENAMHFVIDGVWGQAREYVEIFGTQQPVAPQGEVQ